VSVLGQHFGRNGVEMEGRAVILGQLVFEAVGGHIVLAAAVNDRGHFGAEAFRLRDGIDRGVAAAEHGDAASDRHLMQRTRVNPLDEVEGIDHFGEILAGNAK
ncbi:MAG: hypothetical protein ACK56I_12400, partial [bacterium]